MKNLCESCGNDRKLLFIVQVYDTFNFERNTVTEQKRICAVCMATKYAV